MDEHYEKRKQNIDMLCPNCKKRTPPRESIVKRQYWGDGEWRYTCGDESLCDWYEDSRVKRI